MALSAIPVPPAAELDEFEKAFAELSMPEPKRAVDPTQPEIIENNETVAQPTEEEKQAADAAALAAIEAAKTAVVEPPLSADDMAAAAEAARIASVERKPEPVETPVVEKVPGYSVDELAEAFRKAAAPAPVKNADLNTMPQVTYSTEEQGLIKQYHENYPEIAVAEELKRREEYKQLTGYILNLLDPVIRQVTTGLNSITDQSHESTLYKNDPDYDTVKDKVIEWATSKEQPAYLKKAFEAVITDGSPADIHDLITRWRGVSGVVAPAAATPAAATVAAVNAAATKTQAAKKAAEAAKNLAPVQTKRAGVQVDAIDPNDFDGAFEQFENLRASGNLR